LYDDLMRALTYEEATHPAYADPERFTVVDTMLKERLTQLHDRGVIYGAYANLTALREGTLTAAA
jgi:hypothetical protein